MASIIPIGSGFIGGAIVVGAFALLSAFALVSILLRIIWLCVRHRLPDGGTRSTECAFFTTNLGCYAACLLIANTLNTVAGLVGLQWLVLQAVRNDLVCKLQVVIMQLGNWSTAFFTVAIALHTFNSLVLRVRQSAIICGITISVGWGAAMIAALVPIVIKPDIYSPTEIACNFNPIYPTAKFLLHVLPILLGALFSAGLYSVVFLILRGTLSFKGGIRFSVDPTQRWSVGTDPESYHRFIAKVARAMLWFPVVYIILLVPYSFVQLLTISGFNVAFAVLVVAFVFWFLLGVVNALLTYYVFRVLEPAIDSSLLPVHRDFQKPAKSQRDGQLSEKEGTSSRKSDRFNSTIPSQYSQSSAQYEQQASSSRTNNVMSDAPLAPTLAIGRHIIPQSRIASPCLPEPEFQLTPQRYNFAELKGLPPTPRPARTEYHRPPMTRARAWTTTVPAVRYDPPRMSMQSPHSAGCIDEFPREGRPSLSAVKETARPPVASPSSLQRSTYSSDGSNPPSSYYFS